MARAEETMMGTMDQPLRLTDEQARMVTQPAGVQQPGDWEFRPNHTADGGFFGSREACYTALDRDGCGDVLGPGDDGEHATRRCDACSAPTGHIYLAWLALLGTVALLLAAPVAVADPPPAPDAGAHDGGTGAPYHLTPRRDPWIPILDLPPQPHRPPAGDPPSPSTGDRPG